MPYSCVKSLLAITRGRSDVLPGLGLLWIAVPALVAVFGAVLFFRGLGHVGSGSPGKGTAHVAVGAPVTVIGLALSLLGFNSMTFARLTHEGPVADVSVKSVDPSRNLWQVTVRRLDGPKLAQVCTVQGDEWDIGARVHKWKPWANVMGLD